jgi:hypothetical protein
LHRIRTAETEMRERTDGFDDYNPAMVEDFLEFCGGFHALTRSQIGFAATRH